MAISTIRLDPGQHIKVMLGLWCLTPLIFFHYSSSESEEEKVSKKEHVPLIFKNKKEAMEAFKSLLRDKVEILYVQEYHS
jgi:hypothetical protein